MIVKALTLKLSSADKSSGDLVKWETGSLGLGVGPETLHF